MQFIVWGLFHGLFLIIERAGFGRVLKRLPAFIARLYTLVVVLVAWVFFRAASLYWAVYYLRDMFCLYLDDFKYTSVVYLTGLSYNPFIYFRF